MSLIRALAMFQLICLASEAAADPAPVGNDWGGRTYWHMALDLSAQDLLYPADLMARDLAYAFSEGGMFEIYVPGDVLGAAAGSCARVIVRMPWTDPAQAGADSRIAAKREVFDRLIELSGDNRMHVVLELNPYVEATPDGPRLTRCNAFFRHARGAYLPNTDPLSDQPQHPAD